MVIITLWNPVNTGGWDSNGCRLGCYFPLVSAKQMIIWVGLVGTVREGKSNPSAVCAETHTVCHWLRSSSFSLFLYLHFIYTSFCCPHYVSCAFSNLTCNSITLPPFTWQFYAASVWIVCTDSITCIYTSVCTPEIWLLFHFSSLSHWLPVLFFVLGICMQKCARGIKTVILHDIWTIMTFGQSLCIGREFTFISDL